MDSRGWVGSLRMLCRADMMKVNRAELVCENWIAGLQSMLRLICILRDLARSCAATRIREDDFLCYSSFRTTMVCLKSDKGC